jgi:hypothetical protein
MSVENIVGGLIFAVIAVIAEYGIWLQEVQPWLTRKR